MVLVKICGIKDAESALVALDSGANLVGMIMVPNRARSVDHRIAKEITHLTFKRQKISSLELMKLINNKGLYGDNGKIVKLIEENGPYTVGVFRNQSIEEINKLVEELKLDFVQLHGKEPRREYIEAINVPVILRYVPDDLELETINGGYNQILSLIDGEAGGEGEILNWSELEIWSKDSKSTFMLAGGLTPENVQQALQINGVIGVDVAGGVEVDGVKNHDKIRQFIINATTVPNPEGQ